MSTPFFSASRFANSPLMTETEGFDVIFSGIFEGSLAHITSVWDARKPCSTIRMPEVKEIASCWDTWNYPMVNSPVGPVAPKKSKYMTNGGYLKLLYNRY